MCVIEDVDFTSLNQRERAEYIGAAAKLARNYESDFRILARVKRNEPCLQRVFDPMDVCQRVLANFFFRVSAGQFDIDSHEQLIKLFSTMIRNNVTDYGRRQTANRRDQGRVIDGQIKDIPVMAAQDTTSRIVSVRELVAAARERFASDELGIVELRGERKGWDEIAREPGGSPDALRKKITRAIDRVAYGLGLLGSHDE